MRMREARLRRELRRIVLAALASPLGAAACHAASDGPSDASTNEPDATSGDDARDPLADARADASPLTDAGADAAACAAYSVDGASIEGPTDGCADFRLLPCGLPPDAKVEDCLVDLVTCAEACGTNLIYYCQLMPPACFLDSGLRTDAVAIVDCVSCAGPGGRRPRGLREARRTARTPLGDYFAAMAHLESASVRAFRDLAGWLTSFGAPSRLARAAERAAHDERRHARAATRLARRFGGFTSPPRVRPTPAPTLLELLEDDAIEGCVGETFGALVATWQAIRAADPRVRRTLRRISVDETRHAALSWEILAWGVERAGRGGRDGTTERLRVAQAIDRALGDLAKRAEIPVDNAIARIAGHPVPSEARALVAELVKLVYEHRREICGAS